MRSNESVSGNSGMDALKLILDELKRTLAIFKKNPDRVLTAEYLDDKKEFIRELLVQFNTKAQEARHEADLTTITEQVKSVRDELNQTIRERRARIVVEMAQSIPFRDVEQSLARFDGASSNVEGWIETYEATATLYEWTNVQKYLYCRQLLKGAAKLAVESRPTVNSFPTLKAYLLEEFASETNSASVHDKLRVMRKQKEESSVMFGYRVQALAAAGEVDERATLTYIVRGISVPLANKTAMLTAKTWKDLKSMLNALDQARAMEESDRSEARSTNSNQRPRAEGNGRSTTPFTRPNFVKPERGTYKCFNCSGTGHRFRDCPNPVKCHSCQENGHRSAECPVKAEPSTA